MGVGEKCFNLIETRTDRDGVQFHTIAGGEDDQFAQVAPGWIIPATDAS